MVSTVGRVLAFYVANLGLIPITTYGTLSPSRMITEHRARRKPQVLLGVAPKLKI